MRGNLKKPRKTGKREQPQLPLEPTRIGPRKPVDARHLTHAQLWMLHHSANAVVITLKLRHDLEPEEKELVQLCKQVLAMIVFEKVNGDGRA